MRISSGRFVALTQPALRLNLRGISPARSSGQPPRHKALCAPRGASRVRAPSKLIIANLEPWSSATGDEGRRTGPIPELFEEPEKSLREDDHEGDLSTLRRCRLSALLRHEPSRSVLPVKTTPLGVALGGWDRLRSEQRKAQLEKGHCTVNVHFISFVDCRERERLTEEASAVAHLLDLLDSSAEEPAS